VRACVERPGWIRKRLLAYSLPGTRGLFVQRLCRRHMPSCRARGYIAPRCTSRHKIASRPFSLSRELYHRYRDRGVPSAEEIDRDERVLPLSAMFPDVPKTPHRNFKRDLRSVESRATRFSRKLIILACDRQLISTARRRIDRVNFCFSTAAYAASVTATRGASLLIRTTRRRIRR